MTATGHGSRGRRERSRDTTLLRLSAAVPWIREPTAALDRTDRTTAPDRAAQPGCLTATRLCRARQTRATLSQPLGRHTATVGRHDTVTLYR